MRARPHWTLPGRQAHRRWEYFIFIDADKTEKLCFAMNLKEDQCYLIDISAKTVNHMACAGARSKASATTGAMKVGQRIEGSPDGSRCSAGTIAGVFIAPGAGVLPADGRAARRHERVRAFRYRGVRPDSRLGG
jgi:hypothetical protein